MCKYKEKIGEELKQEARKLGLSEDNWYSEEGCFREAAVQTRVRESKRAVRENQLWIIALVSAIASLFSAIAAWIATIK